MEDHRSRRQFLQSLSRAGATAILPAVFANGALAKSAATKTLTKTTTESVSTQVSKVSDNAISVWNTSSRMQLAHLDPIRWADGAATENTISIDKSRRFQSILGFGGAFTDSACYDLDQMAPETRKNVFNELFGAGTASSPGLNLNVCRTCVGASDYSTVAYSYDDGEADPDLKRFSIEHDRKYILPMLREARAVNPDLFLFSTPWSPPGWMKSNNSMLGGSMRPKYMQSYANYFVKFLKAYSDGGVPIQAVSIQNELDTDQDGRMPACTWPQEYEVGFVRDNLGPALAKNGLNTKVWIIDHNYNLWGRAVSELEDPEMKKFVDGVAWHGYIGKPEWMVRVHDAQPSVNMYWTEGGPDITNADYATDYLKWSQTFTGIMRNWCRSITVWNLALDREGNPNIGPFKCGGLVTWEKDGGITRSGQYYALAHFSAFIKRDAMRVDSNGDVAGVQHVAFENPNGQTVVVLTNTTGADVTVNLNDADKNHAAVALAANSVTTLVWQ